MENKKPLWLSKTIILQAIVTVLVFSVPEIRALLLDNPERFLAIHSVLTILARSF